MTNPTQNLYLSNDDWDTFLEVLANPPQLNEHLKKAFDHYKHIIEYDQDL